ncbi:hypothetical protein [Burkholderia gladioli]|uniref:hypothetical protein n=1 Tax=Burkholderia gladioli TaxID=28095 RepID=UPI0030D30CF1
MTDTNTTAALTDEQRIRASMTGEQIRLERKLTCEAIEGAIGFGQQGTNPPPSDDHWLAPFWKIGQQLALLTSPRAAVPVSSTRIERLQHAIEGECDGLGIDEQHARAILEYVDAAPAAPVAEAEPTPMRGRLISSGPFAGRAVAPVAAQAVAADGAAPTGTPFENCQFRNCDLPGQCKAEGKCHHPRAAVSPATAEPCAHDYVRTDRVCTECGEKTATADVTLPYENVLHDLIRKIVPGLDSGDILNDARTAINAVTASTMTDAQIDAVWENIDTRGSSLYEPHAWEIEKRRRFARAVATGVPVSTPATADERAEKVDCRTKCDVCWSENGERWPCARASQAAAPQANAAEESEDAYVIRRLSETLADVAVTLRGDDPVHPDDPLNKIELVKRLAKVLRLEVELYRAQAAAPADAREVVAYTSPDRLQKIAQNPGHVDTMWGVDLTNEGENIPLYTGPVKVPADAGEAVFGYVTAGAIKQFVNRGLGHRVGEGLLVSYERHNATDIALCTAPVVGTVPDGVRESVMRLLEDISGLAADVAGLTKRDAQTILNVASTAHKLLSRAVPQCAQGGKGGEA